MLSAAALADPPPQSEDPLVLLVETIEALSHARTVEDVAAVVRSAARRISGADGVTFVVRDNEQCWYLDEDAIGPLWKGKRFPLQACISGWAMLNGKTAVIPDIYADARIPHDAYRPTFVKSLVMTPVRPDDPIAAIGAYWASFRQPTEDEIARLQVMARATATALESARLYASLNEALERREFLVRELDHRVKNSLAAAQSIASQTLRAAETPGAFAESFEARLMALARVHELLTRGAWAPAGLAALVREAMAPFADLDGDRVHIKGPNVVFSPETAVAMHMTLHELAVNAAKHGALGAPAGWVEIGWRLEEADVGRRLVFEWREQGGPPVRAPQRRGFGSRMIERGLARDLAGEAQIEYPPEGVRYTLSAPLSRRIQAA